MVELISVRTLSIKTPVTGGLGNFGRLGSERRCQSLEMVEMEGRSRRRGEAEEDQVVDVR